MFNERKKITKKRFLQIFTPVITWAANNKSPLFESIQCSFRTEVDEVNFYLTVFYIEPDSHEFSNSCFDCYFFQDENYLLESKGLLKQLLKAKNKDDFTKIASKFDLRR